MVESSNMMKYNKTTWVDNKTPINSENLNHIEDGIEQISSLALAASDIISGDGIKLDVTEEGKLKITSILPAFTVIYEEQEYEPGIIYLLVNKNTGKLEKVFFIPEINN